MSSRSLLIRYVLQKFLTVATLSSCSLIFNFNGYMSGFVLTFISNVIIRGVAIGNMLDFNTFKRYLAISSFAISEEEEIL